MKLFLVHCGYYDSEISDGLFESHTNVFVVAESFEDAKLEVKKSELFRHYRMHVDGLQEINAVQGFDIILIENLSLNGGSIVSTNKHRDLAPKLSVNSLIQK